MVDEPTRDLGPVGTVYRAEPRPWWRERSAIAVASSFLAVIIAGTVTFVALRPDAAPGAIAPEVTEAPVTPTTAPVTATPTATASPTATTTPTPRASRSGAVVPIPTEKPPPAELPPPPPPPAPSQGPGCPEWDPDNDAPRDVVRAALAEAGARNYWVGASPPQGWPGGPYPDMTIPASLMNAVAWTESSWRSTVIACDQGIGLMQVMPNTAPWMNQRFGRSYDVSTVDGNAALGAMYLQWLRMYFGLYYFGSFDLEAVEPVGRDGAPMRLLDVVLAAYNVGFGSVERDNGTPTDATDDYLAIPNRWYVDRVLGYVANCPCDAS